MSTPPSAPAPIEIDCQTVKRCLDEQADTVLLDCREADEYATARIDGAVLIPMSEIEDRLAEVQAHSGREIVVHCHHGARSLRVAMWLRQQGLPGARSMAGGIDEWSLTIDPAVPRY